VVEESSSLESCRGSRPETFEIETGHESAEAEVSIELYNYAEHRRQHFRVAKTAILLDVLDEGARKLDVRLLPDSQKPLDCFVAYTGIMQRGLRLTST